ncbi:MAG TPA: hypothetical protein VJ226_00455, partial [Bradyrhizobium sp.]|nr:hypothetical protein [Bradyrhizobium sp.]
MAAGSKGDVGVVKGSSRDAWAVIASDAKQSRPLTRQELDCFAELAMMTRSESNPTSDLLLDHLQLEFGDRLGRIEA